MTAVDLMQQRIALDKYWSLTGPESRRVCTPFSCGWRRLKPRSGSGLAWAPRQPRRKFNVLAKLLRKGLLES